MNPSSPAPVEFGCSCGQVLAAPHLLAGRRAECPSCRAAVTIPGQPVALRDLCPTCSQEVEHPDDRCPLCGGRLRSRLPAARRGKPWTYARRPGLPWEHTDHGTVFSRSLATLVILATQPGRAFAESRQTPGTGEPLLFSLWMSFLTAIVIGVAITALEWSMRGRFGLVGGAFFLFLMAGGAVRPAVEGFLMHVAALLVGGASQPLEASLRVAFYAHGATAPVALLYPWGWPVDLVWRVPLAAIGMREVHQTGALRSVLVALSPSLSVGFCCGICTGAF